MNNWNLQDTKLKDQITEHELAAHETLEIKCKKMSAEECDGSRHCALYA